MSRFFVDIKEKAQHDLVKLAKEVECCWDIPRLP